MDDPKISIADEGKAKKDVESAVKKYAKIENNWGHEAHLPSNWT